MTDCDHDDLVTFRGGGSRFWACGNCSLRFYPACRLCVTVGHRNGHEDPAWRATLAALRGPEPIPDTPSPVTIEQIGDRRFYMVDGKPVREADAEHMRAVMAHPSAAGRPPAIPDTPSLREALARLDELADWRKTYFAAMEVAQRRIDDLEARLAEAEAERNFSTRSIKG